jgi:uncharacterized membrane protein YcjF (UPF0283 family)
VDETESRPERRREWPWWRVLAAAALILFAVAAFALSLPWVFKAAAIIFLIFWGYATVAYPQQPSAS